MVLLIVLETRQSRGKGSLSNHRPWWWRWKINWRSSGTLLPQQTHLCESGDAIEFSNACLHSTADAASTDHINHWNELFRTYRGLMLLDIAAKASSPVGISSLNTHKGTLAFKSFPDSTFKGWCLVPRKLSIAPKCVTFVSAEILGLYPFRCISLLEKLKISAVQEENHLKIIASPY